MCVCVGGGGGAGGLHERVDVHMKKDSSCVDVITPKKANNFYYTYVLLNFYNDVLLTLASRL